VMQAAENFVVAVDDHDRAQGKTHDKKCKWLQAFRVAQGASGLSHQITAERITAEKRRGVKNQQNDCVAAELLVTFFRPLRVKAAGGANPPLGCQLGCALRVAGLAGRLSAPGLARVQVCLGGPPPPVSDAIVVRLVNSGSRISTATVPPM
jgi:hypothetical protein